MDTMAHRKGLFAASIAASALVIAGCGGSNEPETTPPTDTPDTSGATTAAPSEGEQAVDTIASAPERSADAAQDFASSASGPAEAAGLSWDAPSEWLVVPTMPGGMRAAQYTAPAPSGSALAPAEVVFFHFGSDGQGGGLSANLERWSNQVLDDAGAPTQPSVATFEHGPLNVTTALYTGTYMSGMPGQQRTPLRGWAMLAAVIEGGPAGTLFVRMTGPEPVVDEQREAFEIMIRTVTPTAGAGAEPAQ